MENLEKSISNIRQIIRAKEVVSDKLCQRIFLYFKPLSKFNG